MSPRKKTLVILASVLGGVLAIGAAVAVPAGMHHHGGMFGEFGFGHGMGRALASLELTDDQKSKAKAILEDEGPTVEPLVDQMLLSKKALFDAVHAPAFDEKSVRSAAAAAGQASTELAVERARILSRFRGILTDDQQARLETIRRQFEERFERHIGMARSMWKEHAADFIDAL
jgi:Spy/CpxP family protein refolding chaperone